MKFSLAVRLTALLLIPALLGNTVAFAASKPVDPAAVKTKLAARGTGASVRVTLTDNSSAKGIIVSIGDQSFTLKAKGVDQPREIRFAEVTGVHGTGLSTPAKIGIGIAIGVGAVALGLYIAWKRSGW
jgi:hypothetical protein